jgi:hypothetical protein
MDRLLEQRNSRESLDDVIQQSGWPETPIISPRPVDRQTSLPETNVPAPAPQEQPISPETLTYAAPAERKARWLGGVPVIMVYAAPVTIILFLGFVSKTLFPDFAPELLSGVLIFPFVFGLVLFWWLRCDFRYAIPLGVFVGIAVVTIIIVIPFNAQLFNYAKLVAMTTIVLVPVVLGNISAELVTRFQQGERLSQRIQFLAALAITMLAALAWALRGTGLGDS